MNGRCRDVTATAHAATARTTHNGCAATPFSTNNKEILTVGAISRVEWHLLSVCLSHYLLIQSFFHRDNKKLPFSVRDVSDANVSRHTDVSDTNVQR